MNEQMEIEYKILLTKKIYEQIKKDYQKDLIKSYKQTNYYLSHPILLKKQYMLRIREKNDQFELTLKRPKNNHQLETNMILDKETKEKILNQQEVHNEIFEILKKENILQTDLKNLFSLTTYRYDYKLKYGILSLDYNKYLDTIDYELEYEVNDEINGYKHFLSIIQSYQLQYQNNCTSKVKRALQQYKKKKVAN